MYVQLYSSFVDASALNFPACQDGERILTDSDGIVISASFLAEISAKSPRKLFIFVI